MLKEFKEFITGGNVIEFAVAVIMAAAIGGVVTGFVNDIIMPIVGEFSGGMDFSQMKHVLSAATGVEGEEGFKPENAVMYGKWINSIINLVIVGFVMFMMIKSYNSMKKKEEAAPAAPPKNEVLLEEIRDLLKK